MKGLNDQKLINEYALLKSDFFTINRNGKPITILRRTGVDKIIDEIDMIVDEFKVDVKIVPGFCVATATIKAHLQEDPGECSWTCASASPENCLNQNTRYAETAETRAKHRALLSLLGLYQLGIETYEASKDFEMSDPNSKYYIKEADQAKAIPVKSPKPEQSIEEMMGKLEKLKEDKKTSI